MGAHYVLARSHSLEGLVEEMNKFALEGYSAIGNLILGPHDYAWLMEKRGIGYSVVNPDMLKEAYAASN